MNNQIESFITMDHKNQLVIMRMIIFFLVLSLIYFWYRYNGEKYSIDKKKETQDNYKLELTAPKLFSEVLHMAETNSPYFWVYFQELYPQFCIKLLDINPTLKVSELIFCAYLYLGFTTKEIATSTFKSTKTIENNRYNIRKRLQLLPNEDLALWLRNRCQ
ncbi:helix-turn-helix transcriptional regulator [Elizabethkingia bruuniana]|uniref:helix-turn-helix transcriptional regulator n=1 Tax=Elizabethkingia bruuniana TaxID=1756149 RepID=UPI00241E8176|nr:hypothetical protein [Elizabethkingia bruuniana]